MLRSEQQERKIDTSLEKFGYEVACPWKQKQWFKLGETSRCLFADEKEPVRKMKHTGVRRYTRWRKDQLAFAT